MVHLQLDARVQQTLCDLLEHARLGAARAQLRGARPVRVVDVHRLGCGRAQQDELGLDPDEEGDVRLIACFPASERRVSLGYVVLEPAIPICPDEQRGRGKGKSVSPARKSRSPGAAVHKRPLLSLSQTDAPCTTLHTSTLAVDALRLPNLL